MRHEVPAKPVEITRSGREGRISSKQRLTVECIPDVVGEGLHGVVRTPSGRERAAGTAETPL